VQKDLHEWQQVMSYLQRRRAQNLDHMVGEGGGPHETRRRELIDTVGKTVQTIVESYDRNKEASELAASVEAAERYAKGMQDEYVSTEHILLA
jgi:ATP-dependent Clp protease ATP-binding subunit ClpA